MLLFELANVGSLSHVKDIEDGAARLGMRVTQIGLRQAADIEAAFKRGSALGAKVYMVTQSGVLNNQRQAITNRGLRSKVLVIAGITEYVEAGGLISYGPSAEDNLSRAVGIVD